MTISNAALVGLGILVVVFLWYKIGRQGVGILAVLAVPLVIVYLFVHSVQMFTGTALVATVQASQVTNSPHTMAVSMTTYDSNGTPTRYEYELSGDRWELDANVVNYDPWINALGISNGFQLSRLTSQYDDFNAHTVKAVPLSNGTPAFTVPFIERAHYWAGVIMPADGVTYNVYVTTKGSMYAVHV